MPPPHQILIFAAVLFMVLGATAGLSIWLTRGFFYQRGYRDGLRDLEARTHALIDERFGQPAEVYDHETEGL